MHTGVGQGLKFKADRWPLRPDHKTIVFIHGSGGTGAMWEEQVRGLSRVANLIALDLPGHGGSEGRPSTSVVEYAASVNEFITKMGLPGPIVCGLSLGGAIAQQMLLDHAANLIGGILVGTGGRLRVRQAIFDAIASDYYGFVEAMPELSASPSTDRELLHPLLEAMHSNPPEAAASDFRACDLFDVMDRLGQISLPVLVVSAEDDLLTPPKYADYLENNIPGASRAHLAGAGHMSPVEKPAEFNKAVEKFLLAL